MSAPTPEQRRWRADKLGDLANYLTGAVLIGQLISNSFHLAVTIIALIGIALCVFYSNYLLKH